ncbi:MAG: SDR family oxidoreductase [Candidatus Obscuribacterales bacterium]|nr:SDR family oxidoreductase [Candidatus Obscuribacterales bacterium]
MDLGIKGKKALVCGASKGMGQAIALSLAHEGANLFLCARQIEPILSTIDEIKKTGSTEVFHQTADLTDHRERHELIAKVINVFGHIDILIHNTGGPSPSAASQTSLDAWELGFNQLFQSVAHLNQAFLPSMIENRWGRIIAVTSLSVLEPIKGLAVSNAMRSAVTAMLKTLADEVAGDNITVNCVAPGLIDTERLSALMETRLAGSCQSRDDYERERKASIPAGRLGSPAEFADVVTFLASTRASYITGSTICLDGGKRRSTS